jgi:hypothetical protein
MRHNGTIFGWDRKVELKKSFIIYDGKRQNSQYGSYLSKYLGYDVAKFNRKCYNLQALRAGPKHSFTPWYFIRCHDNSWNFAEVC